MRAGFYVPAHGQVCYRPDMTRARSVPQTDAEADAELAAAVQAGQASLDAGRSVSYEHVRRWLLSWGTDKELSPPKGP